MSRTKSGTLLGTGVALSIGLDSIPDRFYIKNTKSAANEEITWRKNSGASETSEGLFRTFDGTQMTEDELGFGEGISAYRGGDSITSRSTVYFMKDGQFGDDANKIAANTDSSPITTWTLDTVGNRTGHFDFGVNTTQVGVGSKVVIKESGGSGPGKIKGGNGELWITAISNDGDAADEITLNEAVASGEVLEIGGKTSYVGAPAGALTPAGVTLSETGNLNVSGESLYFRAEWDS